MKRFILRDRMKCCVKISNFWNFQWKRKNDPKVFIYLKKGFHKHLKELYEFDIIEEKTNDNLCSFSSHFGILYGLAKLHKQLANKFPLFRSLYSLIGTTTYNIANLLVKINSQTSAVYDYMFFRKTACFSWNVLHYYWKCM